MVKSHENNKFICIILIIQFPKGGLFTFIIFAFMGSAICDVEFLILNYVDHHSCIIGSW